MYNTTQKALNTQFGEHIVFDSYIKTKNMAYFTQDYLDFFRELSANNNKDWFDINRKRYKTSVKEPFANFIAAMIDRVAAVNPKVALAPKDAIFRINRDIRFSKDKTPYKTGNSAIISPGGRKDMSTPGLYIELSHERIGIYGGVYMCETKQLYRIREEIAKDMSGFRKALNDKGFKKAYGELHGEKNKVIPKEFKAIGQEEPMMYNKQFYYWADLDTKHLLSPKLDDIIMKHYHAAKPVRDFLLRAF